MKSSKKITAFGAAIAALLFGTAMGAATPVRAAGLSLVSEQQELEAGRQAAQQVEQKYQVVGGREADLVERLGRRMAAVSARPKLPWQFRVIRESSVNAFSVPGYVYVHTGLLQAVGNDTDALAGVIAHEVGHVAGRHSKKQMEKSAVAGLLGTLITGGNSRNAGWFNLAGNVVLLKYSRDDEFEADRLAVGYLQRTGYDPRGMIRFFEKLQKQEGKSNKLTGWFQTHPNSGDRIARIRRQISQGER
jgi:predicted Zn-dependent protease